MRRFKTTPQKKLVGMLILFVFIPLFLLWYVVFFLDNKPGLDTMVILGLIVVLALYFYLKYKKQIDAIASGKKPEEEPEDALMDEEDLEDVPGEEDESSDDEDESSEDEDESLGEEDESSDDEDDFDEEVPVKPRKKQK